MTENPLDISIGPHRILIGDVRERLRDIPDNSVHCCVTSPPYFGLRDYSTGRWEGGSPECDHKKVSDPIAAVASSTLGGGKKTTGHQQEGYRDQCGRCGAVRVDRQIGLEPTLADYLATMVDVFREVRRILRPDGTVWLNIGDSYANTPVGTFNGGGFKDKSATNGTRDMAGVATSGSMDKVRASGLKQKDLMMVPARLAIALQDDGWWLRSDIIWAKKAPMPESVQGSQYVRHRVTIAEYERLSNLRESELSSGENGRGNMSDMPRCEPSNQEQRVQAKRESEGDREGSQGTTGSPGANAGRQASLSAEREGQGDRTGAGGTRGRAGEASPVQPISAGTAQQGEVRGDGEGPGDQGEGDSEVSQQRARQASSCGVRPAGSESSASHCGQKTGEREVRQVREDESQEATGLRSPSRSHRAPSPTHGERLDRDSGTQQPQVLLLWGANDADDGSRDSGQQRRASRERERGPSLPDLQLQEERQDNDALLVDCPGCDKCRDTDGWILRWNAGRPTSAHEHVFLLAKASKYYYDADAVREPHQDPNVVDGVYTNQKAVSRPGYEPNNQGFVSGGGMITRHRDYNPMGRNLRNVWLLGPEPFPEAHFATFPTEIPRRAIKAGTSERGVCAACGAPWVRQVDKIRPAEYAGKNVRWGNDGNGMKMPDKFNTETVTTGWTPSCACDADVIPATVLDPFLGSGTTMLVAEELNRVCVGIELNPEYAAMAAKRVGPHRPRLALEVA